MQQPLAFFNFITNFSLINNHANKSSFTLILIKAHVVTVHSILYSNFKCGNGSEGGWGYNMGVKIHIISLIAMHFLYNIVHLSYLLNVI